MSTRFYYRPTRATSNGIHDRIIHDLHHLCLVAFLAIYDLWTIRRARIDSRSLSDARRVAGLEFVGTWLIAVKMHDHRVFLVNRCVIVIFKAHALSVPELEGVAHFKPIIVPTIGAKTRKRDFDLAIPCEFMWYYPKCLRALVSALLRVRALNYFVQYRVINVINVIRQIF